VNVIIVLDVSGDLIDTTRTGDELCKAAVWAKYNGIPFYDPKLILSVKSKLQAPYIFQEKGFPAIVYLPILSHMETLDLYGRDDRLRKEIHSSVENQWALAKPLVAELLRKQFTD